MNNQRRDRRIREISQEINRLYGELQRLLQVGEGNRRDNEGPTPQSENQVQQDTFRIGDQVQIVNRYIGRFGAT